MLHTHGDPRQGTDPLEFFCHNAFVFLLQYGCRGREVYGDHIFRKRVFLEEMKKGLSPELPEDRENLVLHDATLLLVVRGLQQFHV
jgi:hypothetical protein